MSAGFLLSQLGVPQVERGDGVQLGRGGGRLLQVVVTRPVQQQGISRYMLENTKSINPIIFDRLSSPVVDAGFAVAVAVAVAAHPLPFLVFLALLLSRLPVLVLAATLHFLHFCPLVLEPDLDHSDRQPGVLGQRLPHLPARLGADLEAGLELPPLGGGEDGAGPLGAAPPVPRPPAPQLLVPELLRHPC